MATKIKVGVVGFGYWGPNLVRNLYSSGLYELNYICDLAENNRVKAINMYPDVKVVDDYNELLNDQTLELVVIATPIETHYQIAKDCLKHGKHVLVEKPMTTNSDQAFELVDLANSKNLKLAVDHTFLFSAPVRKIKELISDGELGDIYYISSERINLGLIQKSANVFWDLAIHDLSIVYYWLNGENPTRIFARSLNHSGGPQSDIGFIDLEFGERKAVNIQVSWLSPVKLRKILIIGSKKSVYFDDVSVDEKIKIYDRGVDYLAKDSDPFFPVYRSGDIITTKLDNKETLKLEVEELYEYIRFDKSFPSTGEFGAKLVNSLNKLTSYDADN